MAVGVVVAALVSVGPPGEGGRGYAVASPLAAPLPSASASATAPGTSAPVTSAPVTAAPVTAAPVTLAPATSKSARTEPAATPLPTSGWIATPAAAIAYSATPGGPTTGQLPAVTPFGSPQALAVIGAPGRDGWVHVELPIRPNGSTGWISTAGVPLTWTPYSVAVSTEAHTVTVRKGSQLVLTVSAAVGAPRDADTGRPHLHLGADPA